MLPDEFREIDNDPFAVIDQVRFQSSIEDALASGEAETGVIAPIGLEAWSPDRSEPTVPRERLPDVFPALLKACQREKPTLIGVPAAPAHVVAIARQLIGWLPPTLRLACSFDSLSNGRNLTQLPYAIAGLPAAGPPRRYLNLAQFDAIRFAFPQPLPISGPSSFDQWLIARAKLADQPPELNRNEAAFQLATCLDSGQIIPASLNNVDRNLFDEIACADSGVPKLEKLLRARLQSDTGQIIAPLLFALAYNWLRSEGLAGLCKLAEPIEPALILRWLFAIYEQRSRDEIRLEAEVPALKDVLEETKEVQGDAVSLRKKAVLILYRWASGWSRIARWMCDPKMIPDDVFQWFVGWALQTIPIRVSLGMGPTAQGGWCGPEVSCQNEQDAEECQKLVAAILGQDPKSLMDESGEVGGERRLPPDRWNWVLTYLLNLAQ